MPTPRLRVRSRCPRPRALLAAAGLSLALGACHSTQNANSDRSAAPKQAAGAGGLKIVEREPFQGLRTLAAKQQRSPDARAKALPPPPGVEADDVAPLSTDQLVPSGPALMPLPAVLAKFEARDAATP